MKLSRLKLLAVSFLLIGLLASGAKVFFYSVAPEPLGKVVALNDQVWTGPHDSVKLEIFENRPLLIHFWASWCEPCIEELPALSRFLILPEILQWVDAHNIAVLLISLDDDWDPFERMVGKWKWPKFSLLARDLDLRVAEKLDTRSLPATYLLSPARELIWTQIGEVDWASRRVQRDILSHFKK